MDDEISSTSGATEATAPSARADDVGAAGPVGRSAFRRNASLTAWRDKVLMGAESALKERERDARDDEIARLQAKVGEITMANELLYAKIDKLEGGRPLARRRSKK